MDFGMYSIAPATIIQWTLIGFVFAFFIKGFSKKLHRPISIFELIIFITAIISITLFSLLIEGFDTIMVTFFALSIGIMSELFVVFVYRRFLQPLIGKKQFYKLRPINSNIAKSRILPADYWW